MADEETEATSGLTRRKLIKRGAIAGGTLMWVAPAVQSFTSPAGAQVVGSPECSTTICVGIDIGADGTDDFFLICELEEDSGNCLCCCVTGANRFCDPCSNPSPCDAPLVFESCGPVQAGPCP